MDPTTINLLPLSPCEPPVRTAEVGKKPVATGNTNVTIHKEAPLSTKDNKARPGVIGNGNDTAPGAFEGVKADEKDRVKVVRPGHAGNHIRPGNLRRPISTEYGCCYELPLSTSTVDNSCPLKYKESRGKVVHDCHDNHDVTEAFPMDVTLLDHEGATGAFTLPSTKHRLE